MTSATRSAPASQRVHAAPEASAELRPRRAPLVAARRATSEERYMALMRERFAFAG